MSKSTCIGVDNVARKVKKMYIGVDNVARLVTKMYVGVDGVARPYVKNRISFTLELGSEGRVCTLVAENGMTWEEWVNSSYYEMSDLDGIVYIYNKCMTWKTTINSLGRYIFTTTEYDIRVLSTDVIIADHTYFVPM